jgi:glycosyltransferase involved in cell wall biosynthesis
MRRHLSTLFAFMDRERIVPTLFAPADFVELAKAADVPYFPLAIPPRTSPFRDTQLSNALVPFLRGKFDIVHTHGIRGAWVGAFAAQNAGIPALMTAHNLLAPLPFFPRRSLRYLLQRVAKIVAVSQAVSESFMENDIPSGKIEVISNGVDVVPFDTVYDLEMIRELYGIPTRSPLLVGVGRLSPEKGFDLLIAATRYLRSQIPETHLLLVGSGPDEANLRHYAGRDVNLHFAGHQANVIPFLQAADVIGVPSRMEGQGLSALEAMAARKPVVAAKVGGLVEIVEDQVTGLLFPPNDTFTFAQCLAHLLRAPHLAAAMGKAGRERVERRFLAARMGERTESLYRRVLEG